MKSSSPAVSRWAIGSWKRTLHALILGLLQPVVPIALFGGLAPLLFDTRGALLEPPRPLAFAAVVVVASVVLALLVGAGLVGIGRVSLADLGFRRERLGAELLLGVAALSIYLACYYLVVRNMVPDAARVFRDVCTQSPSQRALLLLVGLAIALFEESVFRGYLQPALIHHLGLAGGVALTAIMFAASHPPFFTLPGFLVRLSLGLVTGLSRGQSRPLTAAITAHALLWPVVGLS